MKRLFFHRGGPDFKEVFTLKHVDVFTDGSCHGNPGPGGWGAILCCAGQQKILSGGDAPTTNNRMELTAVIEALKALPSLTDVDLSENPISEVPEWFVKMEGLENVSLSSTKVKSLPDDLGAWKGLVSLQLGGLDLPAKEMARIRAALPGVAIVF